LLYQLSYPVSCHSNIKPLAPARPDLACSPRVRMTGCRLLRGQISPREDSSDHLIPERFTTQTQLVSPCTLDPDGKIIFNIALLISYEMDRTESVPVANEIGNDGCRTKGSAHRGNELTWLFRDSSLNTTARSPSPGLRPPSPRRGEGKTREPAKVGPGRARRLTGHPRAFRGEEAFSRAVPNKNGVTALVDES
jgi:hypothetical protein